MLEVARRFSWRFLRHHKAVCDIESYPEIVAQYVPVGATVADIGAGRRCLFDHAGRNLIAVDISPDELALNREADQLVEADCTVNIPLTPDSVDVVTSHSVIEHMKDVEGYVRNARHILKENGLLITAFPNKRAVPSLLNRMLPHALKYRLLAWLKPHDAGYIGFRVYYEHCSPAAFQKLLKRNGFAVLSVRCGYFQADYFESFPPICALVVLYDRLLAWLNLRWLCANVIVVARRRG